ncbi:sulfurtransferase [Haloplanus salinarum]|jgi:thiosulfate/3-mercaptopyruvate sulfurtransferase|uniref:sulfurtransferase n=1 Tax=Haloplanus salinarum TaxID=1912324 RepID=UPI00214B6F28|nr:sulfurtransferase [Haloplanus salinarum]
MHPDDTSDNSTDLPKDDPEREPETTHSKEALVSPQWVADRLDQFQSDDTAFRLVEVDVNREFYRDGHAPGACELDWETDLQSETWRDIPSPDEFGQLMRDHGIANDTTVVVYGDNSNWFATHLYWQFTMYGHDDVRVMDGGREYWMEQGFPTTQEVPSFPTAEYTVREVDESHRAFRSDVYEALDSETMLIDVRMPEEYRGELTAPPGIDETAQRAGHIPGAINVLWADNVDSNGRFKPPQRLRELYASHGVTPDDDVIAYCRIGERSSITWFALHELLGYESVRNYDGSWTEWGNLIRAPIASGKEE